MVYLDELEDHNIDHIIVFEILERWEESIWSWALIQSEQTLMPNG